MAVGHGVGHDHWPDHVRGRCEAERAVRVDGDAALRRVGQHGSGHAERVTIDVAVIREHGHGDGCVDRCGRAVVGRRGRVVYRRNGQAERAGGRGRAVADRVGCNRHRAVVVQGGREGVAAVGVDGERAHAGQHGAAAGGEGAATDLELRDAQGRAVDIAVVGQNIAAGGGVFEQGGAVGLRHRRIVDRGHRNGDAAGCAAAPVGHRVAEVADRGAAVVVGRRQVLQAGEVGRREHCAHGDSAAIGLHELPDQRELRDGDHRCSGRALRCREAEADRLTLLGGADAGRARHQRGRRRVEKLGRHERRGAANVEQHVAGGDGLRQAERRDRLGDAVHPQAGEQFAAAAVAAQAGGRGVLRVRVVQAGDDTVDLGRRRQRLADARGGQCLRRRIIRAELHDAVRRGEDHVTLVDDVAQLEHTHLAVRPTHAGSTPQAGDSALERLDDGGHGVALLTAIAGMRERSGGPVR